MFNNTKWRQAFNKIHLYMCLLRVPNLHTFSHSYRILAVYILHSLFLQSKKVQGSNASGASGASGSRSTHVFHLGVRWINCLHLFKSWVSTLSPVSVDSFQGLRIPPPSKSTRLTLGGSGSVNACFCRPGMSCWLVHPPSCLKSAGLLSAWKLDFL